MYHCLQSSSNGQPFLLPLHLVREVVPGSTLTAADEVTAETMIKGWAEYRGNRLPIVNTLLWSASVGRKQNQNTGSHLAVLSIYGALFGLETDGIGRIVHLAGEKLLPPSPHLSHDHGVMACITGSSKELIPVLDLHGLLRRQAGKFADQELRHEEDIQITAILLSDNTAEFEPLLTALSPNVHRLIRLDSDKAPSTMAQNTKRQVVLRLQSTTTRMNPRHQSEDDIDLCHINAVTGGSTHLTRAYAYLDGADLLLDRDPLSATADILSAIDLHFLIH